MSAEQLVLKQIADVAAGARKEREEHATRLTGVETKGKELHARLADIEQSVAGFKESGTGGTARVDGSNHRALQTFMKDARFADIAEQRGILRVKAAQPLSTKALLTSVQGSADSSPTSGFDVHAVRDPNLAYAPPRAPTLLDVLEVLPMGVGNTHEFVSIIENENSPGNPDAGADYQILEGDEKPEADVSFALRSVIVATIALIQVISRQLLSDVPLLMPQLGYFFATRVRSKVERELIAGPGGLGRILGLSASAMPYVATGPAPDRVGEALAHLEGNGFMQPFILMHPSQWNSIRSERAAGSGEYMTFGWNMPMQATIWGAPVIRNSAVPLGEALIVDRSAARFIDRQAVTLEISTQDGTNFRRNLATLLCEVRGALEVMQPLGVLSVALDTSP